MTSLIVGGLVCVGAVVLLLVLGFALLYYFGLREMAAEQRLREEGTPVLGVVVMANSAFLQDNEIPAAPALALISFEPPSEPLVADMRDVASELFKLYVADPIQISGLPNHKQEMAKRLKDDSYQSNRRTRVAHEMSLGHTLYMADLWIRREYIPDHVAETRAIACIATGKDEGKIMVIPHEEELAQNVYAAIGATQSSL